MDQKAQSAGANRVYQDFEPFTEWTEDEGSATLVIMLPGFTKDQLRVQVTSKPALRINAERQVDNNTWRRFAKEFTIPSYCDTNEVSAKFERGILSVKFPKLITPQKEKEQVISDEKKQSKTEQVNDEKQQNKTEQEQNKTEQVAPRNEVAHEKSESATHKEKPKAEMRKRLKTRLLDFSVSLKSADANKGNVMNWRKRVVNIAVAILLVMVLGIYVKNAFKKSDLGGSEFQEF